MVMWWKLITETGRGGIREEICQVITLSLIREKPGEVSRFVLSFLGWGTICGIAERKGEALSLLWELFFSYLIWSWMVSLKFYFWYQSKKLYTFEAADSLSKVLAISQIASPMLLCCVDFSRKLRPILAQNVFQKLETEMNPSVLIHILNLLWQYLGAIDLAYHDLF